MKRLIYRYLPILLVALIGLSVPVSRALADNLCTIDFTTEAHGAVEISGFEPYDSGSWVEGQGLVAGDGFDSHDRWAFDIPITQTNVTTITFFTNQPNTEYTAGDVLGVIDTSLVVGCWSTSSCGTAIPWHFRETLLVSTGHYQTTYDFTPGTSIATKLSIFHDWGGHQPHLLAVSKITYTSSDPCGGGSSGGLTKPIASSDLHPQWGMFDYQYVQDNDTSIGEGETISDFPNTVYAFSNNPEAKVSAVAAGVVQNVIPYDGSDCTGAFVIFQTLRRCRVFVPSYISQEVDSLVFDIELVNISTVIVQDADNPNITYTYWLADAAVSVGQDVVAGCVLGKTIQLKNPTAFDFTGFAIGTSLAASESASVSLNGTLNANFRSLLVDAGVMTVVKKDTGVPVQLYPDLTEEPDEANCHSATMTNCTLANPTLQTDRSGNNIDGWGFGQGSPIPGGGVHLLRGGQIRQGDVVIRPDIGYTLSVMARVTTPIDSFYPIILQIGTLTTTVNITEGNYQLKTWPVSAREVSTTEVAVINSLDTPTNAEFPPEVDILKVCLTPDTSTVAPGACFFPDNSFDANGQGWVNVASTTFAAGQAFLNGDGATMSYENAQLLTNTDASPATYHLKAFVRLNANQSFTGQEGKSIDLNYVYPYPGSPVNLGTIDSALVESEGRNSYDGSVNIEHVYTFTHDLVISSNTEGTFAFGVLITDTDGFIKGLRIDKLCLTADTPDGTFPGHDSGPFDPPNIEACAVVPIPIDNNINSWTYFHWKNLQRFFDCTLMVKLNAMYSLINDAWKTTRLFMRWFVVGTNRLGNWITSFVGWLGGHFRNIAIGQVTTVYQSGGSCNDLFCVLNSLITGVLTPINNIVNTLLGLINTAANLFLTVLTGIIGLGLAFLGKLFSLFNHVTGLFTGIIGAYSSATPATIAGLPTCTIDPTSSPFCRAIWILDNTILGGRWAVLLTIVLGIASIHLILWVIGEFKAAIITTGSSS